MTTAVKYDHTYIPSGQDMDIAKSATPMIAKMLKSYQQNGDSNAAITLSAHGGEQIVLPKRALELLMHVMSEVAQGNTITLIPNHAELSTQQAADILNVSRPYLVKLLESGEMPFHKKGTHRRVLSSDVQNYKAKIDAKRMDALDKLTKQAQDLDMGY